VGSGVDRFARAARFLVALGPIVSALGLCAEVAWMYGASVAVVEFFSLSSERNLPTAFSAALLALSSFGLASTATRLASRDRSRRVGFAALACVLAYACVDESIQIHEHLARFATGSGVFYFSWIIPGAAIVVVLAMVFARFLFGLSREARQSLVVAGAVYLGGAIGMELPLGAYTERYGNETFGYAFIDWIEESMEIVGASMFLFAVVRIRARVLAGDAP